MIIAAYVLVNSTSMDIMVYKGIDCVVHCLFMI